MLLLCMLSSTLFNIVNMAQFAVFTQPAQLLHNAHEGDRPSSTYFQKHILLRVLNDRCRPDNGRYRFPTETQRNKHFRHMGPLMSTLGVPVDRMEVALGYQMTVVLVWHTEG